MERKEPSKILLTIIFMIVQFVCREKMESRSQQFDAYLVPAIHDSSAILVDAQIVDAGISAGSKLALGQSLSRRFTQYSQLYTQLLVNRILSSETQRPSAAHVWQMPDM